MLFQAISLRNRVEVGIAMSDSWLLLTNDDGIEARSLHLLIAALLARNHKVAVLAPSENPSATGMKLSLGKPLAVRERSDLCTELSTEGDELYMFELDGTPCDTVITALDGGLKKLMEDIEVKMVISGINIGPNLSQDTYHSGTIAAAREAGLYGMPALACSWSSFSEEGVEKAIEATIPVIEACLAVLPNKPVNLKRPHIDVASPHLSDWPGESKKSWLPGIMYVGTVHSCLKKRIISFRRSTGKVPLRYTWSQKSPRKKIVYFFSNAIL